LQAFGGLDLDKEEGLLLSSGWLSSKWFIKKTEILVLKAGLLLQTALLLLNQNMKLDYILIKINV
jgi:hypothetical protein